MDTFITSLVIFTGLLALLGAPFFFVAWRKNRFRPLRNFIISAVVIGIICATLATVSERQVMQCLDAGNTDCIDSGAVGMQLLFVGLYAVTAWVNALVMWRD